MSITSEPTVEKWSNEAVLQFLDYYRQEPIIWKAAHPKHKIRNDVYDAWKRIEILMVHEYTVSELKKKKESLMASFRTCITKAKNSKRSGAGTDKVYKPVWFAYEKMATFLRNKDDPNETINSEDILSQLDKELQNETTVECLDNRESLHLENSRIVFSPSRPTNAMSSNSRNAANHVQKKAKRCETDDTKKKMDNEYAILQSSITKPERDLCDIYGKLIAVKLKALDEQRRELAMHRMDNILYEIKMNTAIDKPLVQPSTSNLSPVCVYTTSSYSNSTQSLTSPTPSLELQSNVCEQD